MIALVIGFDVCELENNHSKKGRKKKKKHRIQWLNAQFLQRTHRFGHTLWYVAKHPIVGATLFQPILMLVTVRCSIEKWDHLSFQKWALSPWFVNEGQFEVQDMGQNGVHTKLTEMSWLSQESPVHLS